MSPLPAAKNEPPFKPPVQSFAAEPPGRATGPVLGDISPKFPGAQGVKPIPGPGETTRIQQTPLMKQPTRLEFPKL
jgi:hypothetical protein